MYKIYVTLFFFLFTTLLSAQTQISIDSISAYIGKTVKICDTVTGTFKTNGNKTVTYLNFGGKYPNHTFTVVIFEGDYPKFDYPPVDHYANQNVCVTGEIGIYKERPQIVIHNQTQLQIAL